MTVTVQIWKGPRSISYDALLDQEPEEYELPAADPLVVGALTDDEHVIIEDDLTDHSTYAIQVPNDDRPATVNIHTNDSYHNAEDWGKPIERGLTFHSEDEREPFQTEMWGRVMLWVEVPDGDRDE